MSPANKTLFPLPYLFVRRLFLHRAVGPVSARVERLIRLLIDVALFGRNPLLFAAPRNAGLIGGYFGAAAAFDGRRRAGDILHA